MNTKKDKFITVKKFMAGFGESPVGSMFGSVHLEMKSNTEVVLEGSRGIEKYDENMVQVKVKGMKILFFGRNLEIKCLNVDSLLINGFITSVEFAT